MNFRQFSVAFIFCFIGHFAVSAENERPMNILILHADDWRFDTLGCAGNSVVKTPNLDQFASESTRFTQACVTTAICGVSRASLMTGQWMSRHGNLGFAMFKTPWAETYPGLLRANGYWVGHVGKWHNGKFPQEQFDVGSAYSGRHFMKEPDGSSIHVTQKNQRDALDFLRGRPVDRPFCLTVAFFAPHAEDSNPKQYLYQPESESLYQGVTVPVPKTASDEYFHRLPYFIGNEKNEGRARWRLRFDTPEKYQSMMKSYYRLCTEVDAACGKVLEELRKQGVLDHTLVIFTGDNGYFHGDHGLADKWYPYQESIRVPLIVRDPRLPIGQRGRVDEHFVLNVDVAPTILAAAGVPAPGTMQGRDFAPLYLANPQPKWRTEFFYEHSTIVNRDFIPSSLALVRKEMKYLLWPQFDFEELFDLNGDPFEERSLAPDARHATELEAMRQSFRLLQAEAK